ncbi:MAG: NAD-dependent epimerase/dehydratase family protein, partial [Mesorhizobium sp.]
MRILITGAAGMVGRKLIARLAKDGVLRGRKITALDLHDIVAPQAPALAGVDVSIHTGDLSAPGATAKLVASHPDVIFHLAG